MVLLHQPSWAPDWQRTRSTQRDKSEASSRIARLVGLVEGAYTSMNIPRCKHHGCEMVPHGERVPFCGMGQGEVGPGRGHRRPMRITWECPRGDCHWVAIGQAEYEPTY